MSDSLHLKLAREQRFSITIKIILNTEQTKQNFVISGLCVILYNLNHCSEIKCAIFQH